MSGSFATSMDLSPLDSSLSVGFPRQEYWNGLPFPFPGDLPDPGIKPASPSLADEFFTIEPSGKLMVQFSFSQKSVGNVVLYKVSF